MAASSVQIQESDEELELRFKDDSNLWDQLRKVLSELRWTANDIASMSLMSEMNNVEVIFLVRKSDNKLVGSLVSIEMQTFTFCGMYYAHPDYRSHGIGHKIASTYIKRNGALLAKQPFIYRSVPMMTAKYTKEYEGYSFYHVFDCEFPSRTAVLEFFPISHPETSGHIVQIRNLTHQQFRDFCSYDKFVTNSDRSNFLQSYYSVDFVKGVVLFNHLNKIIGCAAVAPTTNEEALYKIGPVYAGNQADACRLIHAVINLTKEQNARFVFLCREKSAGDWILEKCKHQGIKMHEAGALGCTGVFGPVYKDQSRPENIHIGQCSPCYFDI